MTYTSSFSTKNALNFSISSSNILTKSFTSLVTSLTSPPPPSDLARLFGCASTLGCISFICFFKSLYDKNLSRQEGSVSSIKLLRLFQNFIVLRRREASRKTDTVRRVYVRITTIRRRGDEKG